MTMNPLMRVLEKRSTATLICFFAVLAVHIELRGQEPNLTGQPNDTFVPGEIATADTILIGGNIYDLLLFSGRPRDQDLVDLCRDSQAKGYRCFIAT